MSEWKTINSAPKDGTWIIAIRPKHLFAHAARIHIVRWSIEFEKFIWADFFDVYSDDIDEVNEKGEYVFDFFQCDTFTHWMPLPEAPK